MLLSELIEGLPARVVHGDPASLRVTDLTEDSRTVLPGAMFVARAGLRADGTRYIGDAVRAGAAVVLTDDPDTDAPGIAHPPGIVVIACEDARLCMAMCAERFFGNPSGRLLVAGITGTNGKSTVAHLVHGLLNRLGIRCGVIGTVGIDDGTESAPSSMTTPPAIELSRTLATMVDAGCEAAVMEVSSHALDQCRADAIDFDAGVFTNITGDHADYHGSFEAYLTAKQRLLSLLPEGRTAILNADDPRVAGSVSALDGARPVMCAEARTGPGHRSMLANDSAWSVERTERSIEGESLLLRHRGPNGPHEIRATVPLIGGFNAMNICQAVATVWALLGIAGVGACERERTITHALSLATAPRGRVEPVHGETDDIRVFIDFAHTDDALDRVLSTIRSLSEGEVTVVFGCGGERDTSKRPRMGAAAARSADRIVVTSDNPRGESPSAIIDQILGGLPANRRASALVHAHRETAIAEAISGAAPGGVVVIAGKGHETDQVFADADGRLISRELVDQDLARAALAARRERIGVSR